MQTVCFGLLWSHQDEVRKAKATPSACKQSQTAALASLKTCNLPLAISVKQKRICRRVPPLARGSRAHGVCTTAAPKSRVRSAWRASLSTVSTSAPGPNSTAILSSDDESADLGG